GETMLQLDELEAKVRVSVRNNEVLEGELADLRQEVPALESEIDALRAELTSVRARLENESILLRVANQRLEGNRMLIERAKKTLVELVADEPEVHTADTKPPPDDEAN
ncbi:MAG: hypothetical protein JNL38_39440, partial [Myxococcales bacterium]|nr:hypothetical protein [Myxococcales bacterium]